MKMAHGRDPLRRGRAGLETINYVYLMQKLDPALLFASMVAAFGREAEVAW